MNFRNISAWSIRNPIIPIIIFIGLTLAGIVSFIRMDVQNDPDIEFPIVIVTIMQPGAAPSEMATQITEKVESAVQEVEGIDQITSSVSEGVSTTVVQLELGEDVNDGVNEVKSAIDEIRNDLPDGILEPRVFKRATSSEPFASYAVEAEDMTMEQLSWFVDDTVSRRLLAVDGMASVQRRGGVDREIRVIVDPARMEALGVTAAQINDVLRQSNLNVSGGEAEIAGTRQAVRVLGDADSAYQLGQRQIALSGGRNIKLSDIAEVKDAYGEIKSMSTVEGKPVVTFELSRSRGKSDVTVYDSAIEEMKKLESENPGVHFVELSNKVTYAKDQYSSSMNALVEGAILAVVVVFLFLRDWRATIISAVAIPLSAIPTFFFLDVWFGFTLNTMSLLALGLVAGVLVDDAIVEIENIVRHMRMGKNAYEASIEAADEIGVAVLATTLSIVAVFLPVGLMPGVHGQFFRNFGLTVVTSVLMSLAVARLITPMFAAYFMKDQEEGDEDDHAKGRAMDMYMSVLRWTLDRNGGREMRAAGGFGNKLKGMFVDHRIWMMGVGFMALLLTVGLIVVAPKQLFPDIDTDFSLLDISMVPGTTLEQTYAVAEQAVDILEAQPETELVLVTVEEGSATLNITLKDDRERPSMVFERDLIRPLSNIPDARLNFVDLNSPGGGGGSRDVNVMLIGSNYEGLEKTATDLVEQMKGLDMLTAPRLEADLQRPELIIKPRTDIAASLGVTTASIAQVARIATIGEIDQNAAKFSLSNRQVPIRVQLSKKSRANLDTIKNLPVPTASGGSVPLYRVADIRFGMGPTTIERYNQNRRIFVGADLAAGINKSDADAAIAKLPALQNMPAGVSTQPAGTDKIFVNMIQDFTTALISGILLVFAVLVLLYKRFMSPLVNMGSLLLAPLGGMLALVLIGQPMTMPVFIGILMLFGIVAKNSILLIDFALEEMAAGRPKFESIVDAGRKRAQPIVMTTVAMTAGMVPTALSLGGDGAWRAPMGTVVIGGLIVATFLTLLIVPAGFSLADGLERRMGPWLRRKFLTYRTEADDNYYTDKDGGGSGTGAPPSSSGGGLNPAE